MVLILGTILAFSFLLTPAFAAYYSQQINFEENVIPMADYQWETDEINICIYKENNVPNSYYVWTKLAAQNWRQALRDYTGHDIKYQEAWSIAAKYTDSGFAPECNVRVYIYDSYEDFPGYPEQTGAYTAVEYSGGIVTKAEVYLAPVVKHGIENVDIDLPSYAFRNSAAHEFGHVFGFGHMRSQNGYLMSPQFDFWQEDREMPLTTLELSTLVDVYGENGWSDSGPFNNSLLG